MGVTRHALLIGIGDYSFGNQLEGPRHDVEALAKALIDNWGVEREHVTTLVDGDATRTAILAAIDALLQATRPGDQILLFFSGHGTSAFDERLTIATGSRLDPWTGALVPYGYTGKRPLQELIIGNHDLRPRLAALDHDRFLFVVFDACYSQYAVRSVSGASYRFWQELSPSPTQSAGNADRSSVVSRTRSAFDEALAGRDQDTPIIFASGDTGYPYSNTVYLSAAARDEVARDIRSSDLAETPTIDGKPHGAMTNALLHGLSGSADSNNDHRITYRELHVYVRDAVVEQFQQEPQILAPTAAPDLLDTPVLGLTRFAGAPPPPRAWKNSSKLQVALEGVSAGVRKRISQLPGVELVTSGADLRIVATTEGYTLLHASGDLYHQVRHGHEDLLIERIRGRHRLQALLDLEYPRQQYNVYLEIPGKDGFLRPDDPFQIRLESELQVTLLLIAIDPSGGISVLFPFNTAEMEPTLGATISDGLEVSAPYGTEHLKLIGFADAPEELQSFTKEDAISPTSDSFDRLMAMLLATDEGRAEAGLKVVSVPPEEGAT
jgi:hypothetical protein